MSERTGPTYAQARPDLLRRGAAAALGVLVVVAFWAMWAGAGGGYFWPRWVYFGLGVVVAIALIVPRARATARGRDAEQRWLIYSGAALVILFPLEITVWALSGGGAFWPVWPLAGASIAVGVQVWLVARRPDARAALLSARVDTLTRSRRGAVEQQAADLRRIERDLHDGTQARLVSLALTLGIAEDTLRRDPAAAVALVSEARTTAGGALEDLRAVMRGIYPPVLADRGLGGAVRGLALDVAVPVEVTGEPAPGLGASVEAAAYFAVAECLANTVKHADAAHAWVIFRTESRSMVIEVGDDGRGGADATGGGLTGIARRLEPFDATLELESPAGGPTRAFVTVPR